MLKFFNRSLITCGIFALSCFAQNESLLIGPGDSLEIEVYDTPEMSQLVRVTDAGIVSLSFVGDLKVAGITPPEAGKVIEKALMDKNIMRQPQVTVRVSEYASLDVSVLGQVRNPGAFPITTAQPILKVLSLAGGLNSGADRDITIERHQDRSQKIHYYLSNDGDQAFKGSVLVYPGDTVLVGKAPMIYVLGDVARPGGYSIATNDSHVSVLQLIAMAGSANKTAKQSNVRLIRKTPEGQKEQTIELGQIQKGKQPDLALQPEDVLYVPFSWMKNMAVSASAIAASTSSAAIYTIH